jgi:hypothetical protein
VSSRFGSGSRSADSRLARAYKLRVRKWRHSNCATRRRPTRTISKLATEYEGDGGARQQPPTAKDLLRRHRIDQLLESIAASIPSSPRPRGGQLLQPPASDLQQQQQQQQAPIYRSGRTFPTAVSQPATRLDELRGHKAAPTSSSSSSNGSNNNNNYENNPPTPKSASSPHRYGIVWTRTSPADNRAGMAVRGHQKARPMAAIVGGGAGGGGGAKLPRSYPIDELGAQINDLTDLYQANSFAHLMQDSSVMGPRKSHRSGTEEFPIQTPVHSQSGGDFETKRVENSRGWNNLRGMWGKRSTSLADDQQLPSSAAMLLALERRPGAGGADDDTTSVAVEQQRRHQQDRQRAPQLIRSM